MHWKCSSIDGWEGKHKREQRKYNDRQAVLTVDADVNGDGNVASNWKYRVTMPVVICHNQPAVCISFQATTNHTNNKHTQIQWKIIKTKQKLCDVALGRSNFLPRCWQINNAKIHWKVFVCGCIHCGIYCNVQRKCVRLSSVNTHRNPWHILMCRWM